MSNGLDFTVLVVNNPVVLAVIVIADCGALVNCTSLNVTIPLCGAVML